MTMTLWRGNELLGELQLMSWECEPTTDAPGKPRSCTALLDRAPVASAYDGVMQGAAGDLVVQQLIGPSRPAPSGTTNISIVELNTEPPEDAVPPEKQFTVRDASGKVYHPPFVAFDGFVALVFTSAANGPGYAMAPTVAIAEAVDGIKIQSDAIDSYLHRPTGRVLTVSHAAIEATENGDQASASPQELRLAAAILQTEGEFLALPCRFEVDENCVMNGAADADECYTRAAREWCVANEVEFVNADADRGLDQI